MCREGRHPRRDGHPRMARPRSISEILPDFLAPGSRRGPGGASNWMDKCRRGADHEARTSIPRLGARIMNTEAAEARPGRVAKLLAVLSVACFWLLPLSP